MRLAGWVERSSKTSKTPVKLWRVIAAFESFYSISKCHSVSVGKRGKHERDCKIPQWPAFLGHSLGFSYQRRWKPMKKHLAVLAAVGLGTLLLVFLFPVSGRKRHRHRRPTPTRLLLSHLNLTVIMKLLRDSAGAGRWQTTGRICCARPQVC
jgi:hypothetical protein